MINTMTNPRLGDGEKLLAKQLATANPDVLRGLLSRFIHTLMSADADAVCRANYAQSKLGRANSRNGYRRSSFNTRVGTIELAIPRLRSGSYFPEWLLQHRDRSERVLTNLVTTCYLLGVSTQRVERLIESLGITSLSKFQASILATKLNDTVEALRNRPLDNGPYPFVAIDSLMLMVQRQGRIVGVQSLIVTGVNAEGYREVLGTQVCSTEDRARWRELLGGLVARGLSGVTLLTSDPHPGLLAAVDETLPGATWQRCPIHYTMDLLAVTPKASWPWVRILMRSIFNQSDADSVASQYNWVRGVLNDALPEVAEHLDDARSELLMYTALPHQSWDQIWSNSPCVLRNCQTRQSIPTS